FGGRPGEPAGPARVDRGRHARGRAVPGAAPGPAVPGGAEGAGDAEAGRPGGERPSQPGAATGFSGRGRIGGRPGRGVAGPAFPAGWRRGLAVAGRGGAMRRGWRAATGRCVVARGGFGRGNGDRCRRAAARRERSGSGGAVVGGYAAGRRALSAQYTSGGLVRYLVGITGHRPAGRAVRPRAGKALSNGGNRWRYPRNGSGWVPWWGGTHPGRSGPGPGSAWRETAG